MSKSGWTVLDIVVYQRCEMDDKVSGRPDAFGHVPL